MAKESDYQKNNSSEGLGNNTPPLSSFGGDWDPREYLAEFYNPPIVVADELEAIKFQVEFLRSLPTDLVILEFGAGPTIHRAIAAAPYASEIHMVDYIPENLKEIQSWLDKGDGRHDWSHYVEYVLKCEGMEHITPEQIQAREDMVRSKITRITQADAGNPDPLGVESRGRYAHVYSGFCADSATGDKSVWEKYMRNIASLVAPGGTFFTAALRDAQYYKSGEKFFPSANVNEEDLRRVLELDFSPPSIKIEVRDLPEHASQGYTGIVMASASKPK